MTGHGGKLQLNKLNVLNMNQTKVQSKEYN